MMSFHLRWSMPFWLPRMSGFTDTSGIDLRSLARVAVKSLVLGQTRSGGGGSTLSQQLAKTLFPRDTVESSFPGAKMFKLGSPSSRSGLQL